VQPREQEHQPAHDERVAEEALGLRGDGRAAQRRGARAGDRVPEEAGAAVREVRLLQHDRDRGGRHERDERQVQAAQAQSRKADDDADDPRDDARGEHEDRERQPGREAEPQGDPPAEGQEGDLSQRDHADPADEDGQAERHDAVDDDLRADLQPVVARQARQQEEQQQQEDRDADGVQHRPARGLLRGRPRRDGARARGAGLLSDAHCYTLTSAGCLRANHSSATIANRNGVIDR
jgi:hypothetical protein